MQFWRAVSAAATHCSDVRHARQMAGMMSQQTMASAPRRLRLLPPQTNNKDGQPIAHSANVNKACHATQAAKSRDLWQEMCHVVRYDSK